jgi:ABC-type branched-subunit amino acid transport system ATPase component
MLTLDHVDSFYGRSQALFDLHIAAPSESIYAILGRNGVG